ncbi:hypothetical protein LIER_38059 [Lithospermum erythrorhizon]|uniref:Uncharacterized protein n=1 Tax=Lithospermum erythrorhizon TaxID=34254 RepID=A0AAV3PVJ1_LITER
MRIQNYNPCGDPQPCSSSGIQPSADSSQHPTLLETPLNYSIQYPVSSAQIPFLDAEFDGIGDVSNLSQAYYNGTTANDVDFMFSQPSDPTWIKRFKQQRLTCGNLVAVNQL